MPAIKSMIVTPSKSGKSFSIVTTYTDGKVISWGRYTYEKATSIVVSATLTA